MSACKSCGAEVRWAVSESTNKRMPLDYRPSLDGNIALRDGEDPFGDRYARVIGNREVLDQMRAEGASLYTSHFATCPNAKQHRSKR